MLLIIGTIKYKMDRLKQCTISFIFCATFLIVSLLCNFHFWTCCDPLLLSHGREVVQKPVQQIYRPIVSMTETKSAQLVPPCPVKRDRANTSPSLSFTASFSQGFSSSRYKSGERSNRKASVVLQLPLLF